MRLKNQAGSLSRSKRAYRGRVSAVSCQDENVPDIFDLAKPSADRSDVIGPTDFVGDTEEINEGYGSLAHTIAGAPLPHSCSQFQLR